MKIKFTNLLLVLILVACGPDQQVRSDIIAWGKEIGRLKHDIDNQINTSDAFISELTQRVPTAEDCAQLKVHLGTATDIYNDAIDIKPPEEARLIHNKFIESIARNADAMKYYTLYVCENDGANYDKYTESVTDTNRLSEEAFHDLQILMEEFSISCGDIDLCKNSNLPPTRQATKVAAPSCLHWSKITAQMAGQKACVYGTIYEISSSRETYTRYQFSPEPNTFVPGECIMDTEVIATIEGVPYIDVGKDILFCEPGME